jgi:sortase A
MRNLKIKNLFKPVIEKISKIFKSKYGIYVKGVILLAALYLVLAPFIPEIVWRVGRAGDSVYLPHRQFTNLGDVFDKQGEGGDEKSSDKEINMIAIPAVGIEAPIVEGEDEDALSRGAWRRPLSSTPDEGGNTVITGHRFQYLPPNNLTFYHLDKAREDDKIFVYWDGMQYDYVVTDIFVVEPSQVEIEENTAEPRLTLYTCTPLWTAQNRLVIIAEPVRTGSNQVELEDIVN